MTINYRTQDYVNRLWDQFDAIDDLLAYAHGPGDLERHRFMLNSALMSLTQIGEIVAKLTRRNVNAQQRSVNKHFDEEFTAIREHWESVIGLRNIAVHEYNEVDVNIVWRTLIVDVKDLKDTMVVANYVRREPEQHENLPLQADVADSSLVKNELRRFINGQSGIIDDDS